MGSPTDPHPATAWLLDGDAGHHQRALAAGDRTAEEFRVASTARIAALDRVGPSLHAVIGEADPMVAEASPDGVDGRTTGALHGLPVLIKDNIDVAGRETTAGSILLAGNRRDHDAPVVASLRRAGATIVAKTNLSEWANFRSTRSSSGWSSAGGQCRNPHATGRSPLGSSSGSAAGVAAGYAPIALGTETDGSILCPAAACGVVGLKPTVGTISVEGVVPIAPSQDVVGPIARSVADVAVVFDVLRGRPGGADAAAAERRRHALAATTLAGRRIGVAPHLLDLDPATAAVFDGAVRAMADAGAVIVPVDRTVPKEVGRDELTVLLSEFGPALAEYLSTVRQGDGADLHTLGDVIAANRRRSAEVLPWFGQELFALAETRRLDIDYEAAVERGPVLARAWITDVLGDDALDAIVAPTLGPAWRIDLALGDRAMSTSTMLAATAGWPAITVPMGAVHGLPGGLSWMAEANSEDRLLDLAAAFEAVAGPAPRPRFVDDPGPMPAG